MKILKVPVFFRGKNVGKILFSGIFLLFFISCKKENVVPTPSLPTGNEIQNIVINKADNPSFTENGYTYVSNETAYITIPVSADLTKVNLSFKISEGATLKFNGNLIGNLSGTFDLSNTAKATVTSASGSSKNYIILARTGINEIDKNFYEFKEQYSIPGVSFAILKMSTGEIVYKAGYGFAVKESETRLKPDYLFRLGSISKQFTSICIMKLIEQGVFNVESTVFGPEGILKEQFTNVSEKAKSVTVRNLLDHSSGWESDPDPMFTSSFSGQTLDQRIQYVLTSPQSEPGSKYSYFNMGYGILGKIIEVVTGKKYETFLKEVLAEADIHDIHVGGDKSQRRTNEVIYYSQDGTNGYANDMEVIAAAGGVIASTEQMLKLITYIDGKDNPKDILKPETRTLMLTNSHSANYALGWRMNHRFFPGAWYHGGNLAGTGTFWVMGPEYSTVILCNSRSYKSGFDDDMYIITDRIMKLLPGIF